jgi:aconitate hydratase
LWRINGAPAADYTDVVELDLSTVEPSLAGPKRPQDRVPLRNAKAVYRSSVKKMAEERAQKNPKAGGSAIAKVGSDSFEIKDGAVLIAAITSCTNTSNPAVLVAAGLLARNALKKGLASKPWVKTSLAPGSRVVTDYLSKAGLLHDLEQLGFYTVGYGCTTCIGNSGPLKTEISEAVRSGDVVACSVLSGNRNFEGRVHPEIKMNFLASPPLVVAYALAGSLDIDITTEPLGLGTDGKPVYLKDVWPSAQEVAAAVASSVDSAMFKKGYANVFLGDANWGAIKTPAGKIYSWDGKSTYVKNPPYFDGMTMTPAPLGDIKGARALAVLGDSVTTDHISPAGNISKSSPAAKYLIAQGVQAVDFNSYGARRGNHEVMMRGTFANIRLRNLLLPGTEGGVTLHIPSGEQMSIFDASVKYKAANTPLVILAGKEYGTGSSRDWAAKGTMLLGVKAVIAESFERIHRSNLIGMGVLPLQYKDGQSTQSLGLTGKETFEIVGLNRGAAKFVKVIAKSDDGTRTLTTEFEVRLRIDTPKELDYYQHGGILQYVLRQLAATTKAA